MQLDWHSCYLIIVLRVQEVQVMNEAEDNADAEREVVPQSFELVNVWKPASRKGFDLLKGCDSWHIMAPVISERPRYQRY